MKLERWDPFKEFDSAIERFSRTVNHSYSSRTEDSFGPWAVDILARQDHNVEKSKPKMIEINPA